MKRLYNEYHAADVSNPDVNHVQAIMTEAFQRIWDEVVLDDVCPRDVEALCHSTLAVSFAENILRKAMQKRKIDLFQL